VVFDNLHPQVHGENAAFPEFDENVFCAREDICDAAAIQRAVAQHAPDLIFHLSAETGTGQSYDLLSRYCAVNVSGTACLIEALRQAGKVSRLVLAGSRAVYGEGLWRGQDGRLLVPPPREPQCLAKGQFIPTSVSGEPLEPMATPEDVSPAPASIYGSTKLMQEYLVSQGTVGSAVESVILRFQNVYGPGQTLRNPYTGVLSIFCGQILSGQRLNIYEDGEIVRDFVFVDDVVEALMLAGTAASAPAPINIGSGRPASILSVARLLLQALDAPSDRLRISGDFRAGDVRYAVADILRAKERLAWQPRVSLEDGLRQLASWARSVA
jgi:dTDP-L-rhamnose 4-epimerase